MEPKSQWLESFDQLLEKHPALRCQVMGFPDNWLERLDIIRDF